jgi:hypothetical protein
MKAAIESHGMNKVFLYIFLAAAIFSIFSWALSGLRYDVFSDDAYYYTIIARNFAESGRFTFDGISETNGFHPVLFWVQVLLSLILGPDVSPLRFYYFLVILFAGLLLGFVGFFVYASSRLNRNTVDIRYRYVLTLSVALCLLPVNRDIFFVGMESTLTLPLCVLIIMLVYFGKYAAAGFIGVLLVASRLDTIVYFLCPLSGMYGIYEWYNQKSLLSGISALFRLALPAVAFVLIYMLFNLIRFDNWMPIHGALKNNFPRINVQLQNLFGISEYLRWLHHYRPFVSLLLAVAGGCLLLRPRQIKGKQLVFGITMVVVTLTQLAGFVFFQKWAKPIPPWYQGLPLFTGIVSMAVGLSNQLSLRVFRIIALFCLVPVVFLSGKDLVRNIYNSVTGSMATVDPRLEVIHFIGTMPQNAVWAYTDCGKIAFWSDHQFVNLDGMINNFDYQEYLNKQELREYLKRVGVRYLIAGVWNRKQMKGSDYELMYRYRIAPDVFSGNYENLRFYLYSYLYGTYSDVLMLPKNAEIWRSRGHIDGSAGARFVIYDLNIAMEYTSNREDKD